MNRPSLSDLNRLLLIIVEELRIYNIWPENCWFFSSLVRQHIAAADFSLLSPEKINVKHVELGRDIREQLFARYYWGPEPDSGIQLLPLGVTLKALKRVKPSPPNSHRVLSSVEANLAIVYSAANRTDNARNFMITLHQLARSFAAHSCVNEVLALIAYSRHIAPKAYAGYDLDSEVANSFYLEGYTLYRGGRHSSAVESLKKSIQLYHKLDPLNNVQTLRNLIRSHNTISWAHVETEPKLALENALEATQLAEIGDQRFGSGPNSHLAWCRWLLPQSLSAVSKAYLGIENFKEAQLHGRRAAELSREAFNSHASPDTAAVFAYALNRYETSLDALGLHEDTDLDELCSPNEWRNMLPWLNNTWSAFSYVAGRVEALNKSS
ncbi:hypothetical protein DL93DRAFT_581750 [Clavulina sp. PMI_390]|nr:hypothetical protein DL93DRAFT_581750 [Clavulina sp. PMI_390]